MDIKVINEENEFINENQEKLPGLECATLNFIKDYLVAFSEFIKGEFRNLFFRKLFHRLHPQHQYLFGSQSVGLFEEFLPVTEINTTKV